MSDSSEESLETGSYDSSDDDDILKSLKRPGISFGLSNAVDPFESDEVILHFKLRP